MKNFCYDILKSLVVGLLFAPVTLMAKSHNVRMGAAILSNIVFLLVAKCPLIRWLTGIGLGYGLWVSWFAPKSMREFQEAVGDATATTVRKGAADILSEVADALTDSDEQAEEEESEETV